MRERYVVYRRMYGAMGLAYMRESTWDGWCVSPQQLCARQNREVSRGHTYTQAVALTEFANKLENNDE